MNGDTENAATAAELDPETERLKKALALFEQIESTLRLGVAHLTVVLAQLEL